MLAEPGVEAAATAAAAAADTEVPLISGSKENYIKIRKQKTLTTTLTERSSG